MAELYNEEYYNQADEDFGEGDWDWDYDDPGDELPVQKKGGKKQKKKHATDEELEAAAERLGVPDVLDELYQVEYEDLIQDIPTRFKYRQSDPKETGGITAEEILFMDDRVLRSILPTGVVTAPYRQLPPKRLKSIQKKVKQARKLLEHASTGGENSASNDWAPGGVRKRTEKKRKEQRITPSKDSEHKCKSNGRSGMDIESKISKRARDDSEIDENGENDLDENDTDLVVDKEMMKKKRRKEHRDSENCENRSEESASEPFSKQSSKKKHSKLKSKHEMSSQASEELQLEESSIADESQVDSGAHSDGDANDAEARRRARKEEKRRRKEQEREAQEAEQRLRTYSIQPDQAKAAATPERIKKYKASYQRSWGGPTGGDKHDQRFKEQREGNKKGSGKRIVFNDDE